jgi:regulator of RNase E activity RraA
VSIGFRIHTRVRRVDQSLVARFREIPVANVSDVMSRMTAGGARLRPMHAGGVLAGPALTVKSRPGDNLMAHAALNRAQEGDVLVVDAGGDLTNSIMGELMSTYAEKVGLRGVVIDGAIRDYGWVRQSRFLSSPPA